MLKDHPEEHYNIEIEDNQGFVPQEQECNNHVDVQNLDEVCSTNSATSSLANSRASPTNDLDQWCSSPHSPMDLNNRSNSPTDRNNLMLSESKDVQLNRTSKRAKIRNIMFSVNENEDQLLLESGENNYSENGDASNEKITDSPHVFTENNPDRNTIKSLEVSYT